MRGIHGLVTGVNGAVTPMYLVEIAPSEYRGFEHLYFCRFLENRSPFQSLRNPLSDDGTVPGPRRSLSVHVTGLIHQPDLRRQYQ
jgi:hypothetical protein